MSPTRDKWMCNGLVNKAATIALLGKLKDITRYLYVMNEIKMVWSGYVAEAHERGIITPTTPKSPKIP